MDFPDWLSSIFWTPKISRTSWTLAAESLKIIFSKNGWVKSCKTHRFNRFGGALDSRLDYIIPPNMIIIFWKKLEWIRKAVAHCDFPMDFLLKIHASKDSTCSLLPRTTWSLQTQGIPSASSDPPDKLFDSVWLFLTYLELWILMAYDFIVIYILTFDLSGIYFVNGPCAVTVSKRFPC